MAMSGGCGPDGTGQGDEAADGSDDEGSSSAPATDAGSGSGSVDDAGTTTADAEVVYWRDIKPIVDARCGACHSPDGVAPFALDSYAQVKSYGEAMLAQIEAGVMPPWPAAPDCNEYLYDPTVPQPEQDSIAAWIDLGKPEGDPADEGAPLAVASAELPRIDFELAMAEPHTPTPPAGEVDEHRCFLIDWPEDHDTFVSGYEVIPGNRKVVHHLVARVVDPAGLAELRAQDEATEEDGWSCGAGTGMSGGGGPLLGVWVPGAGASVLPEGTGMRVEPGSAVMLNMHYNIVMGDTSPDQTKVAFMVEDEVEQEGESQFITDPSWPVGDNMLIAADDPDSVHTYDHALPIAMTVYAGGLHMHTLGSHTSLKVEHADGSTTCAFDIPRWDFDWQLGYRLATPIEVVAGDHVVLQCGYDNSAANQPIIDGEVRAPQDVTWGEDTYDEMCLGFVYVTRG
jgi:Copper type II ascorbate-dependent monooxygenase, C-terminal domain